MSLALPPELRKVLELLGADWPATDETVLMGWGADLGVLAGHCVRLADDLDHAVVRLAEANEGDGIAAALAHIRDPEGAAHKFRELATGLQVLSAAYQAIGVGILLVRIRIIMVLVQTARSLREAAAAKQWGVLIAAGVLIAQRAVIDLLMQKTVEMLLGD